MKLFATITLYSLAMPLLQGQKKPLSIDDFAGWNRLENRQISRNGKFISYEINPQKGDGKLLIYNVETKKSDTLPLGFGAQFSPLSNFVVYKIKTAEDTLRKLKLAKTKKEKMPKDSLAILNLTNGETIKFAKLNRFQVAEENSPWVAFLTDPAKEAADTTKAEKSDKKETEEPKKEPKKKSSAKKEKDAEVFDLTILNPISGEKYLFNRVDQMTVATKGQTIAFTTKITDTTNMNALVVFNGIKKLADTLFRDSATMKSLTLDEQGLQLAWLASGDTAKEKNFALYFTKLEKPIPAIIADSTTKSLLAGHVPGEHGKLFFSTDGTKLFFGTAPKIPIQPKDTVLDEEKPRLDLWSWTDNEIQPQQLKNAEKEKKKTFLTLYRIKEKQIVQVADSAFPDIRLINRDNGEVALAMNDKPYLKERVWSSRYLADYSLVDLKNGARKELMQGKNGVSLSPTGKFTLWFNFEDSSWNVIDNKTQKLLNLTQNMNISFVDEENDMPNDPDAYGIAGWVENEQYVLIYDRFDVWRFDPTGKQQPVNLTNGRDRRIQHRYIRLDNEEVFISLKNNIIMKTFDEITHNEGYGVMNVSKPENKNMFLIINGMLGQVQKANDADRVIWSEQSVGRFPEIIVSGLDFANFEPISETNPQQKEFWWPRVEMVSWRSFGGDSLRGMLYKPENFDASKKYPMMVYFYERSSQNRHRYNYPQPSRSTISIPFYVSNGYLVFVPDIVYETGYPGQSAYNAIVSGVYHLTATCPFINEKKIGLQGQSWGGYQIAYLVTQTNLFAAAMAGAPVSNMTSAYGGIRWESGMSRMFQYEETQSRIGGTLWEKPLRYVENSPLFMAPKVNTPLLMMSNDNDGAVPWYQGVEFFMALYRLQKPVWMINYNGMGHNLESQFWANRVDLSRRMFQFFNHYLKDEPAPEWMLKGIPAVEKGKRLGY